MKTRKERDGARIRKNWRMGDGTLPTGKFGGNGSWMKTIKTSKKIMKKVTIRFPINTRIGKTIKRRWVVTRGHRMEEKVFDTITTSLWNIATKNKMARKGMPDRVVAVPPSEGHVQPVSDPDEGFRGDYETVVSDFDDDEDFNDEEEEKSKVKENKKDTSDFEDDSDEEEVMVIG